MQRTLDTSISGFTGWVMSQPDENVIGITQSSVACPVANYLHAQGAKFLNVHPGVLIYATDLSWGKENTVELLFPSNPIAQLMHRVDALNTKPIELKKSDVLPILIALSKEGYQ